MLLVQIKKVGLLFEETVCAETSTGKTLQNLMEKIWPGKQCKHMLRKKSGGRALLCTVLLGKRLGTTRK